MTEMDQAAELAYKKACLRFIDEYIKFNNKYVSLSTNGIFSVETASGIEPFIALGEVIHWTVIMYDKLDKAALSPSERALMSGIKHIDNIVKHEKAKFDVSDFIKTVPKNSVKGTNRGDKMSIKWQVTLCFFFQDISMIPVEPDWRIQRKNYNTNIKDKEVNDVISQIDKILKKYVFDINNAN